MALTLSTATPTANKMSTVSGGKRYNLYSFQTDNSYPVGGYPITPRQVGLKVIQGFLPFNSGAFSNLTLGTIIIAHFNFSTSKLQMFWGNAGSASVLPEVPDGTDLSAGFNYGGHGWFVGF